MDTKEKTLRLSISFINTTTFRAKAGRVSSINEDHRNTPALRLVANILPELKERPVGMSRSLFASYSYPLTDTAQFFEGNGAMGVIRNFYDSLTDRVVGYFLKTGLLAGYFFEFTFGRLRAIALQITAAVLKFAAVIFNTRPAKSAAITIRSDVDNAEVDSKNALYVNGFGSLHITNNHQIELAFDKAKIAFPVLAFEQFKLVFTAGEGHLLSTFNSPDIQFHAVQLVGQDAVVKGNCAAWFESPLAFLVQLVRIRNLADATDNHLRGQSEHFLDVIVGKFMDRDLAKRFTIPCLSTDVTASGIGNFKSLVKCISLFRRWKEFYLSDQFHSVMIPQFQTFENGLAQERRQRLSLPTAKATGFSPRF